MDLDSGDSLNPWGCIFLKFKFQYEDFRIGQMSQDFESTSNRCSVENSGFKGLDLNQPQIKSWIFILE